MINKNGTIAMSVLLFCSGSFVLGEQCEVPAVGEKPDCDYVFPAEYVFGNLGVALRANGLDSEEYWKPLEQDGARVRMIAAQIIDEHGTRNYFGQEALEAELDGDGEEYKEDVTVVNQGGTLSVDGTFTARGSRTRLSPDVKDSIRKQIQERGSKKGYSENDTFVNCNTYDEVELDEATGRVSVLVKKSCSGKISLDKFMPLVEYTGDDMSKKIRELSQ